MSETTSRLSPALMSRLDHIILATPDLDLGIDTLEKRLGVRAIRGGQHLGHGTRNALVPLGGGEISRDPRAGSGATSAKPSALPQHR